MVRASRGTVTPAGRTEEVIEREWKLKYYNNSTGGGACSRRCSMQMKVPLHELWVHCSNHFFGLWRAPKSSGYLIVRELLLRYLALMTLSIVHDINYMQGLLLSSSFMNYNCIVDQFIRSTAIYIFWYFGTRVDTFIIPKSPSFRGHVDKLAFHDAWYNCRKSSLRRLVAQFDQLLTKSS